MQPLSRYLLTTHYEVSILEDRNAQNDKDNCHLLAKYFVTLLNSEPRGTSFV